jgi:hypothetical protein
MKPRAIPRGNRELSGLGRGRARGYGGRGLGRWLTVLAQPLSMRGSSTATSQEQYCRLSARGMAQALCVARRALSRTDFP